MNIKRFSIVYSSKHDPEKILITWRDKEEDAKILARALRKAEYDVDVWENFQKSTKLTTI